jgi:hypothetical protein
MQRGIWVVLLLFAFEYSGLSQTDRDVNLVRAKTADKASSDDYAVIGAKPIQESSLRAQIRAMRPEVLPLRVMFVQHWKYVAAAKAFRLHVPAGFTSSMFTHLPSRSVFVDADRYFGEDWLGYWMAHELGHLASNSVRENDAEKAAHQSRRLLKQARIQMR